MKNVLIKSDSWFTLCAVKLSKLYTYNIHIYIYSPLVYLTNFMSVNSEWICGYTVPLRGAVTWVTALLSILIFPYCSISVNCKTFFLFSWQMGCWTLESFVSLKSPNLLSRWKTMGNMKLPSSESADPTRGYAFDLLLYKWGRGLFIHSVLQVLTEADSAQSAKAGPDLHNYSWVWCSQAPREGYHHPGGLHA